MTHPLHITLVAVLLLLSSPATLAEETAAPTSPLSRYVRDAGAWTPPPIRPEGFQFEIQISSLGGSYELERVRRSIEGHDLGEHVSAVSAVIAAEWGYSFNHLNGQVDGAGRAIEAGYPTAPTDRAACLGVIEAFLHRQYIKGAAHPWASMNGHYPWHHYAAEFGFDQIGSELGENINSYQWHIALTRGAARQYRKPWFIDFSAWHGPSITDYSTPGIWGEYSGAEHGHSMSLFERTLFMSYMAGAGQITAEAGGAIAFLPEVDDEGRYRLSPYGEVCKRLRDFAKTHPDVGIPLTPFALVLDKYHGAYPGFGERKAFGHFDYTAGDTMTWDLINLIWPGGWEVMGKEETGSLVNGPYGDNFDILLQNAPQQILDSYPCLILSGDVTLSDEERARLLRYVEHGGTLLLNEAYRPIFADQLKDAPETRIGTGGIVCYGPAYAVGALDAIIRKELETHLPVRVSGGVQYLVNPRDDTTFVTLINNDGVTKAPREPVKVDATQSRAVVVEYDLDRECMSIGSCKGSVPITCGPGHHIEVTLPPGEVVILELQRKPPESCYPPSHFD